MRIVADEGRVVVVDKDSGVTSEEVAATLGKKLVHRIDRGTSGLLLLADDARTVQRLQRALAAGLVQRRYLFIAHGVVDSGVIESELVRDRGDGLRGSGVGGKPARTLVTTRSSTRSSTGSSNTIASASLCEATLVTGRTHQIRIHLAERGHPLVGERVYVRDFRGEVIAWPRLLLHAWQLAFPHPTTKQEVTFAAAPSAIVDAARALSIPWPPPTVELARVLRDEAQ